jgi:transposase InsO family protein
MLEHVGYDFAHAIVDDHSRLAYVELHTDERAPTITAFVERALAWFDHHGIEAKRLMTDNAWGYTRNRSLRELLASREIKHIRTQPYRPQTNGKVCVLGWGCRPLGRRGSPHLLV